MPASRQSRRAMAIKRRQTRSSRAVFLDDVRNSLPRVPVGSATAWEAGRRSLELSMDADRWLREHGYDRSGRPLSGVSA